MPLRITYRQAALSEHTFPIMDEAFLAHVAHRNDLAVERIDVIDVYQHEFAQADRMPNNRKQPASGFPDRCYQRWMVL